MGRPLVKAAGITAGTMFIAIGLAAQFGGADIFGTPSYAQPVSQAHSPPGSRKPSPSPSPSQLPPVAQSASASGTIYTSYREGGGHKKHK
jgi:hypothetical protein